MELFKNVPTWERYARMVVAVGLIAFGVILITDLQVLWGVIVIASGLGLGVTALVGWCPLCAMAGRKLPKPERVFKVQKLQLHD